MCRQYVVIVYKRVLFYIAIIDDEDLDEEDLELLEENMGIKLNRSTGVSGFFVINM